MADEFWEDIWQPSNMKGGCWSGYAMAVYLVLASAMHVVIEALVKRPAQAVSMDNKTQKVSQLQAFTPSN